MVGPDWVDAVATGFIISAGTEGANSILKFLGYAKDSQKGVAAQKLSAAADSLNLVNNQGKP